MTGRDRQAKRILVVEDEYLIAGDLVQDLVSLGWQTAGPIGSVDGALALIAAEGAAIDGAVLDIKLGSEWSDPVADALRARNIPFVFATAYSARIPKQYLGTPHCQKPCDARQISALLAGVLGQPLR